MPDEFYNEYLGCPHESLSKEVYQAADEYEYRCESFDRTVCTTMKDGIALPNTGAELGLINRNARMVREDILKKYSLTWEELKKGLDLNI